MRMDSFATVPNFCFANSSVYVVPLIELLNCSIIVWSFAVNVCPEQHPEERLEVVHERVLLAQERPDYHERSRPSPSKSPIPTFPPSALYFVQCTELQLQLAFPVILRFSAAYDPLP